MKLSLNWIKDFVQIPEDMELSRLAYDLTMSTVEVEGAENLAERFDKIVVGEIKEVLTPTQTSSEFARWISLTVRSRISYAEALTLRQE